MRSIRNIKIYVQLLNKTLNSRIHKSKEINCTPTAGMNCNSEITLMVVTDFFSRPFSKILPLTTKKDNPSFYFHAHYEKTVIVGTRMNCSAAALSKKEKQKWVM